MGAIAESSSASLPLNYCNRFSHYCAILSEETISRIRNKKWNDLPVLRLADLTHQRCSLSAVTVLLLLKILENDGYSPQKLMTKSRAEV